MSRKALIVAHGHPELSKGGAEVAAWNLFDALRRTPGWDAHLLARHAHAFLNRADTVTVRHGPDETLFANETESVYFSLLDPRPTITAFRNFLQRLRPDVVHFHHYWQVGLELLADKPEVDVVLVDIMMPDMDGYETIREIRAMPRFANLPVVAVTAKAMKGDRQKCIQAGASDYVSKPVDIDQLISVLRVSVQRADALRLASDAGGSVVHQAS